MFGISTTHFQSGSSAPSNGNDNDNDVEIDGLIFARINGGLTVPSLVGSAVLSHLQTNGAEAASGIGAFLGGSS